MLSGSPCATDTLTILELDNCPLLTDTTLNHLISCHSLQRIELYDCQLITRAGIQRLKVRVWLACSTVTVVVLRTVDLSLLYEVRLLHSSGQINLTTGCIVAACGRLMRHVEGSVVFARLHLCAPHLIHASLDPPKSKSQTASGSVRPFLHSSRQNVPVLCNGPPLLPQNCLALHLIHGSLGPPESTTQTASRSDQPFLQGSLL